MKKQFFTAVFISFVGTIWAQTPEIKDILKKNTCSSCHKLKGKLIAPSWRNISEKQYSTAQFTALVAVPVPSNWSRYKPMIGLPNVPKEDIEKIAAWVNLIKQ
jgi:cytochrome c551/c552